MVDISSRLEKEFGLDISGSFRGFGKDVARTEIELAGQQRGALRNLIIKNELERLDIAPYDTKEKYIAHIRSKADQLYGKYESDLCKLNELYKSHDAHAEGSSERKAADEAISKLFGNPDKLGLVEARAYIVLAKALDPKSYDDTKVYISNDDTLRTAGSLEKIHKAATEGDITAIVPLHKACVDVFRAVCDQYYAIWPQISIQNSERTEQSIKLKRTSHSTFEVAEIVNISRLKAGDLIRVKVETLPMDSDPVQILRERLFTDSSAFQVKSADGRAV